MVPAALPLDVVVVGGAPWGIAGSPRSVWISDLQGDRVVRIDPHTRTAVEAHGAGDAPCWIATADDGALWVSPSGESFLDPDGGTVTDMVEIASASADAKVTFAFGNVWATSTPDGDVVRIDPASRRVIARIHVGAELRGVVAGGAYGVSFEGSDRVVAIDPATGRIAERHRTDGPSAVLSAT